MGTTIREMEELLLPVNSLFANAHLSPYSNLPPCLFLPVSFFLVVFISLNIFFIHPISVMFLNRLLVFFSFSAIILLLLNIFVFDSLKPAQT